MLHPPFELPNLVLDAVGAGTWDWNIETDSVVNSPGFAKIIGDFPTDGPRPRSMWRDRILEEDRKRVSDRLAAAVRTGSPYAETYRIQREDGAVRWVEDFGRVIETDKNGKALRMVGAIRDVSEEMAVKSELRESEQRFSEIVESLPGAVMRYNVDADGVSSYTYVSPRCADLFDIPTEDILEQPGIIRAMFSAEDLDVFHDHFVTRRDTPERFDRTITFTTRAGEPRSIHAISNPSARPDGSVMWTSILHDVTHQVALESELSRTKELMLHSQKLETIGQLSGGVAHDFNNLLSIILGNLELAIDEEPSETVTKQINDAMEAARRGSALIKGLLSFARKAPLKPQRVDLNEVIRGMDTLIRRTLRTNIGMEMSLMGGLWPVTVDKSSAESALLNLVINARDAMPNGGHLTIETTNMRLTEAYVEVRQETVMPGRYVMVAVTDTGTGISPELLQKVFEPFFSTKGVGKGSGLGLSSVLGFTKQSGGTTRIYSEPGVGTSVKMFFRAEDGIVERPLPTVESGTGNLQKILLVEDEDAVRRLYRAILEREGYRVLEAPSGDQGLKVFMSERPFDLILTDIVMPGKLMGTGMVREIRKLDSEVPAIFVSGYPTEAAIHGNGLKQDDTQLMKPITRKELLGTIRKVLDS